MTRRWKLLAAALLVIVAAGVAYRSLGTSERSGPRYRTENVTRGDLVASVTATGTVNPVKTVQVGTYVSGPMLTVSLIARDAM